MTSCMNIATVCLHAGKTRASNRRSFRCFVLRRMKELTIVFQYPSQNTKYIYVVRLPSYFGCEPILNFFASRALASNKFLSRSVKKVIAPLLVSLKAWEFTPVMRFRNKDETLVHAINFEMRGVDFIIRFENRN